MSLVTVTKLGSFITQTTAAITYYVDPVLGTDAFGQGLSTGTGAFATIQYAIDSVPKYLAHNVTIQCADATYSITTAITIAGFIGHGIFLLQGNSAAIPGTTNYVIDKASNNINAISVDRCTCQVQIIGFYIDSDVQQLAGIRINLSQYGYIQYVRSHNHSQGVLYSGSMGVVVDSDMDDNDYGVRANSASQIRTENLSSSTINDINGLLAEGGGIRRLGTQPTGSSAATATAQGGSIT